MLEPTASENETPTEPGMQNDARNLAALNAPRFSAYSTGPFDKQRISSLLAQFRADISGKFHGHRVKADRFDPYSGELLARRTGRTFISVVDTPRAEMTVLPTAALQLYFGNRMPPTADSSHLSSIPADTLDDSWRAAADSWERGPRLESRLGLDFAPRLAARVVVQERALAMLPCIWLIPEAIPTPAAPFLQAAVTNPPRQRALSKEQRDANRKERNRLSANKSNQKKRLEIEGKERELVRLTQRAAELKQRRREAMEENERLRAQLGGRCHEAQKS